MSKKFFHKDREIGYVQTESANPRGFLKWITHMFLMLFIMIKN